MSSNTRVSSSPKTPISLKFMGFMVRVCNFFKRKQTISTVDNNQDSQLPPGNLASTFAVPNRFNGINHAPIEFVINTREDHESHLEKGDLLYNDVGNASRVNSADVVKFSTDGITKGSAKDNENNAVTDDKKFQFIVSPVVSKKAARKMPTTTDSSILVRSTTFSFGSTLAIQTGSLKPVNHIDDTNSDIRSDAKSNTASNPPAKKWRQSKVYTFTKEETQGVIEQEWRDYHYVQFQKGKARNSASHPKDVCGGHSYPDMNTMRRY